MRISVPVRRSNGAPKPVKRPNDTQPKPTKNSVLTAVLLVIVFFIGLWVMFLPSGIPFLGPIRFAGFLLVIGSGVFVLGSRKLSWLILLTLAAYFLLISWESYYLSMSGSDAAFIPKPWRSTPGLNVDQFLTITVDDFKLGPLWRNGTFWFAVLSATLAQVIQAYAGSKASQVEEGMTPGERRTLLIISWFTYGVDLICAIGGLQLPDFNLITVIGALIQIIVAVVGAEACFLGASGGFKALGSYAKFLGGKK